MRVLRHIRAMLTEDIARSVACSLVNSSLDYAYVWLQRVWTRTGFYYQIMSHHILYERVYMMNSRQDMTTLEIMISAMLLYKYSRRAVFTDNLNILFENVCMMNTRQDMVTLEIMC